MNREIVDALIESMNDPDAGWVYDEYDAVNERIKCSIWLASGLTFLGVEFWGDKIAPHATHREPVKFGGFNMAGPLVPWRHRIYWAATRHQSAYLAKAKVTSTTIVAAIRSASAPVEAAA